MPQLYYDLDRPRSIEFSRWQAGRSEHTRNDQRLTGDGGDDAAEIRVLLSLGAYREALTSRSYLRRRLFPLKLGHALFKQRANRFRMVLGRMANGLECGAVVEEVMQARGLRLAQ